MNNSFVFAVQGEGRGHLTQAIAVYEMLTQKGHQINAVLIGSSNRREIPAFVKDRIKAPIITYPSPNFITDKENKSIHIGKTIRHNLAKWKLFRKSIATIKEVLHQYQPDIVLNFYEPLIGLGSFFKPMHSNIVSIAHQFIYLHPEFQFPEGGNRSDQLAIKKYTKLTAKGSAKLVALSFYPLQQQVYKNIIVSPPLLRKEVANQELYEGDHLLVYLLNSGYMQDIINWNKANPGTNIHCFTDSATVKGAWQYSDTLCFHSLDDQKFLRYMAGAKALVTTAGFETVCEALYMGKPALMVPVKGHFEQWCNARDAAKAGAGIYADGFELDRLLNYLPHHEPGRQFAEWTGTANKLFVRILSDVLHEPMEEEEIKQPFFQLSDFLPGTAPQPGHS
ncbi:MAG: hypothetical protein KGZ74_18410 [Chitinophagaceae bacterium]|nr:hypothetical protein [Chitinophagaceae bacterium]